MGDVREPGVMATKRVAHFKSSQEKRSNLSGGFLEELHIEKSLEIWAGFGQEEGMKWAYRLLSL